MANRNKKPLEWQFQSIETANATPVNGRIELGLRDDEVAEIHKVMTSLSHAGFAAGGADDVININLALSMDPDVIANPYTSANQEDLEWFYTHRFDTQIELTTQGAFGLTISDAQNEDFDPPVMIGTDIGMVVKGDGAIASTFWVRVFFSRRRATVMELNQVLLKRR